MASLIFIVLLNFITISVCWFCFAFFLLRPLLKREDPLVSFLKTISPQNYLGGYDLLAKLKENGKQLHKIVIIFFIPIALWCQAPGISIALMVFPEADVIYESWCWERAMERGVNHRIES